MDHEGAARGPGDSVTSREQDAVRLLLLIDGACEPLTAAEKAMPALEQSVGVMRTQVKLQKLDFWLRNPDYLANELLTAYEGDHEEALLDIAGRILDSEEPEVRRYPMLRHHFGAYEWLDDALSVLRSAGLLIRKRRGTVNRVRQHDYFLLEHGRHVAREIIRQEPAFDYYVQRVEQVMRLAGEKSGTELKKQQYLTREYAETPRGSRIGAISEQARRRLAAFRQELQEQGPGAA
ncbi:hypothetical protein OG252_51545 [Streptomyces sp. NBC_01352]|uniref:hypothetical protein n=1 Tax=Streptomyces sp. NBC_01352 TaxID=2903834 RepID=UPI002E37B46C|nr:hypothetical protein [Streptomyces sp. NBC_01352]